MKKTFLIAIAFLLSTLSFAQCIKHVEAEEGGFYTGLIDDEWGKVDSLVVTGFIGGEYNCYFPQMTDLSQFFNLTGLDLENCQIENNEIKGWAFSPTGINSAPKANMPKKGYTHIKTEERYFRVNLKYITFPKNLKSIGEKAFFRCNLKEIDIPASVSRIESGAFAQCDYLKSVKVNVYSPDMIDIDGGYAFSQIPKDVILYVPKGTKTVFETDEKWSKTFKTIKEFDDVSGMEHNVMVGYNKKKGKIFSLNGLFMGTNLSHLSNGFYIVGGKKIIK